MHEVLAHSLCISEARVPTASITVPLKFGPVGVIYLARRVTLWSVYEGNDTIMETLAFQGLVYKRFSGFTRCDRGDLVKGAR